MCARHAVQDPARRRDDAVAAFLLDAGQAAEELVGDVLAEAGLAERPAGELEPLRAQHARRVGRLAAVLPHEFEHGRRDVVDLAEVVPDARDFEPVAVRADHAPPREVVERGAPQHGFLAARIHGDVAADAGGVGRGRVDREHEPGAVRRFLDAARDDARLGEQRRHLARHAGQRARLRPHRCARAFRC